jgi:hypothetical protein
MGTVCRISCPIWRLLAALLLALALALSTARQVSAGKFDRPAPDSQLEPSAVEQQGLPKILHLRLQVMPEFDDPRVLVIGQGRLAGGEASAPWVVSFWIPAGAQVNLISGMHSMEAEMVSQPYTLQPDPERPGWALLSSQLDSPHFFYEYYYAGLDSEPTSPHKKSFEFNFRSPHEVERLSLELQQPRRSSQYTSNPAAASNRQDDRYGLTYHLIDGGSLPAGQPYFVRVSYTRSDPSPSVSRQVAPASSGLAMDPPAKVRIDPGLGAQEVFRFWVGGAMLLLIGLAVSMASTILTRRSRFKLAAGMQAEQLHTQGCCTSCGQPQRSGALYCYSCGSRLDSEISAQV